MNQDSSWWSLITPSPLPHPAEVALHCAVKSVCVWNKWNNYTRNQSQHVLQTKKELTSLHKCFLLTSGYRYKEKTTYKTLHFPGCVWGSTCKYGYWPHFFLLADWSMSHQSQITKENCVSWAKFVSQVYVLTQGPPELFQRLCGPRGRNAVSWKPPKQCVNLCKWFECITSSEADSS